MADPRDQPALATPVEVLGEADHLMARHRPAAAPRPVDPRQQTLPNIPTLTDVVAGPVRDTARAAPPPAPRRPTAQADQLRRLEEYVYSRIKERLDGEVDALVEQRLMPGAADAIAQVLGEATELLKSSVRDLIREAVLEGLKHIRENDSQGATSDPSSDPDYQSR
jgi:hypothetical protein